MRLNKELAALGPQQKESEELKAHLSSLNKKFAMVNSLTSSSLLWSKKLYDLSESMIDGVWLTSLSLASETQAQPVSFPSQPGAVMQQPAANEMMVLQGCAVSSAQGEEAAIVGKFINSLKSHKGFSADFDDIKLASIQRKAMGKTEAMEFTIICYFKRGRSYFERPEGSNI
jgi:Tfp pilus assembly protein PilN